MKANQIDHGIYWIYYSYLLLLLSATGIEDKHLLYIVVCSESKILIGCMKISDDHKIDRK